MVVKQAIPGQGFDCNSVLSDAQAAAFKAMGMSFCIRYIPRQLDNFRYNLTNPEMLRILNAGLSLMAVQHVSPDNWLATSELGTQYGEYGAQYCLKTVQLPLGVSVWLDLEMVSENSLSGDIVEYCNAWWDAVNAAGYVPGIYVGWQTRLSPQQLYDLKFTSYWKGYNADIDIPNRGYCIEQSPQKTLDGVIYDPDTLAADKEGSLPLWVSP